jgi:hypothetical protein
MRDYRFVSRAAGCRARSPWRRGGAWGIILLLLLTVAWSAGGCGSGAHKVSSDTLSRIRAKQEAEERTE